IEEPAIAAQHQCLAGDALAHGFRQRVENRLNEPFDVTRLAEHVDFLAQARRTGPLVRKGGSRNGANVHRSPRGDSIVNAKPPRARPDPQKSTGAVAALAARYPTQRSETVSGKSARVAGIKNGTVSYR